MNKLLLAFILIALIFPLHALFTIGGENYNCLVGLNVSRNTTDLDVITYNASADTSACSINANGTNVRVFFSDPTNQTNSSIPFEIRTAGTRPNFYNTTSQSTLTDMLLRIPANFTGNYSGFQIYVAEGSTNGSYDGDTRITYSNLSTRNDTQWTCTGNNVANGLFFQDGMLSASGVIVRGYCSVNTSVPSGMLSVRVFNSTGLEFIISRSENMGLCAFAGYYKYGKGYGFTPWRAGTSAQDDRYVTTSCSDSQNLFGVQTGTTQPSNNYTFILRNYGNNLNWTYYLNGTWVNSYTDNSIAETFGDAGQQFITLANQDGGATNSPYYSTFCSIYSTKNTYYRCDLPKNRVSSVVVATNIGNPPIPPINSTIYAPTNTTYNNYTIPFNFTVYGNYNNFNITINSSCNNNTLLTNVPNATYTTGTLTCTNTGQNWFSINSTNATSNSLFNFTNVTFTIQFGINVTMLNGYNNSCLNNFFFNVTNGTSWYNTTINCSAVIDQNSLPVNTTLLYYSNPNSYQYYYPDASNLNGILSNFANRSTNLTITAYNKILFTYSQNQTVSSGPPSAGLDYYNNYGQLIHLAHSNVLTILIGTLNWTLGINSTLLNTTINTGAYFINLSSQNFAFNNNYTFNGTAAGIILDTRTLNITGYTEVNLTGNVSGINYIAYQELTSTIIPANWTFYNTTNAYVSSSNLTTNFTPFAPNTCYNGTFNGGGSGAVCSNPQQFNFTIGATNALASSSGYYGRNYYFQVNPYNLNYVTAYLPIIASTTIIVRFHITDTIGNNLVGASVTLQRLNGSALVTVGSSLTQADGSATFYMDSNVIYTVIACYQGVCVTLQLQPVQNDYYIKIGTGSNSTGVFNYNFSSTNVTMNYTPLNLQINDNITTMGCTIFSPDGRISYFGSIIYYSNDSGATWILLHNNTITGSPNGGSDTIQFNTSGRTNANLSCYYQDVYATFATYQNVSYTIYQINPTNTLYRGFTGLGQSVGFSLFLALLAIIISLLVSSKLAGGNYITGIVMFILALTFFQVIGLFNTGIFFILMLLSVILFIVGLKYA